MKTTVDLEPEAYRLARALAAERHQSLGQVLSDAVMSQRIEDGSKVLLGSPSITPRVEVGPHGFPNLFFSRPVTQEEIDAAIHDV